MTKSQAPKSPEEFFDEATEDTEISPEDLRLLTSGLMALHSSKEKTVNNTELRALFGMISYVAYSQEINEATICEIFNANYGVDEMKLLPSHLYQNAIEFLVDLDLNKIIN